MLLFLINIISCCPCQPQTHCWLLDKLNSWSSCLHFPGSVMTGMHPHLALIIIVSFVAGWGGGGQRVLCQREDLGPTLQHSCERTSVCNLSISGTGGSRRLSRKGERASRSVTALQQGGMRCLEATRLRGKQQKTHCVRLWSPHHRCTAHTHACTHSSFLYTISDASFYISTISFF